MKFIATKDGFKGTRIRKDKTFDADEDFQCKWAVPYVEEGAESEPDPPEEEVEAPPEVAETESEED